MDSKESKSIALFFFIGGFVGVCIYGPMLWGDFMLFEVCFTVVLICLTASFWGLSDYLLIRLKEKILPKKMRMVRLSQIINISYLDLFAVESVEHGCLG